MTYSLAEQVTRLRAVIAAARTSAGVTMSATSVDHLDHGLSILAENALAAEAETERLRWAAGATTDAARNAGCPPSELVAVLRDVSTAIRRVVEGRVAPASALAASISIAQLADRVECLDREFATRAARAQREADETLIEGLDAGRVVLLHAGRLRPASCDVRDPGGAS